MSYGIWPRAPRRWPGWGSGCFLTIGRQGVDAFADGDGWFLIRAIDPPEVRLPRVRTLLARGPFTVGDEVALLRERRIDVVVTKNSGGALTSAKLEAGTEGGGASGDGGPHPDSGGDRVDVRSRRRGRLGGDGVLPLPK